MNSVDMSAFFWSGGSSDYGTGVCFRGKCIGDNEKGISGANQNFGTKTKSDVVGMLIPHVEDLLISGADAFISYI